MYFVMAHYYLKKIVFSAVLTCLIATPVANNALIMTMKMIANFENLLRRLERYVARVSRSHLHPTLSMAPSNYIFISFAHSDTIRYGPQDN